MVRSPPDWLVQDMAAGMMLLVPLNLRRAPATEDIKAQCLCWAHLVHSQLPGLTPYRDSDRILAAFQHLGATKRTWPYPADLLAALNRTRAPVPARTQPLALPAPDAPTQAGREALRAARSILDGGGGCHAG